ncbi:unnamed protein product [Fraxinus pennsylvanica]|uniref:SHSP domain-containing protein n=1 Tax=Fraxinus pennsylvanica TaxID=56036 RepID=A0AAD2E7K7_9LAMI|nr:unnamed protein product [Fraxinus pennsylvanica]
MEAKPADTFIEEFEPLCKWQRKEDQDILEVHLKEFKKEQLRVQISNLGILKISGERPLGGSKKSRFYKEVPIPKDFDSNAIRAKFVNGCLCIAMPKKIPIPDKNEKTEPPHEDQTKKQPQNESDQNSSEQETSTHEDQTQKQPQNGSDQNSSKQETSAGAKSVETTPAVSGSQPRKSAVCPRLRTFGKVVVTLAALAALIAYVVYMYRSMVPQDDEEL